jgi:TetR/AcrR family transcriptional regulator, cholesterol catabolism regulator
MTRDEILEAAAQIFREKGFHAASMQDIAQAVNLQKASLYYHVTSKQEILLDLLDRALDLLIQIIEPVTCSALPPDQKVREAVRAYLQAMLDNRDLAAVLLLEHRSLEPQYQARHIPRRDRFEHLWRDMLQEGLDQEVFSCADAPLAARYLLGVLNWTITWYRRDGDLTPDSLAAQFADLYLSGLLVRGG